jgi:hypothetical protein
MPLSVPVTVFGEAKGESDMSLERTVEAFAGFMVLLSVAPTYVVHPAFV